MCRTARSCSDACSRDREPVGAALHSGAQLFRLPCVGAARGGSCVVRGLGDRGVRRRVEGDPDCGMSPVHPMPDMPFPDLIACLKGGEARCEATYAEYSLLTGKVTTHSIGSSAWFSCLGNSIMPNSL